MQHIYNITNMSATAVDIVAIVAGMAFVLRFIPYRTADARVYVCEKR